MWFALLLPAFAACDPELPAEAWTACWQGVAAKELSPQDASALVEQWNARPEDDRAVLHERLGASDAAWWVGRALLDGGVEAHGFARAVLDGGDPAQHDQRALWYTGFEADRVWNRWVQAQKAYEREPTKARREAAQLARIDKWAFWDHAVVERRLGLDGTENLHRCMVFTGVKEYCGAIEALDEKRTDSGW